MKLIYQNFDALELAFQCAVPIKILSVLENAKREAQEARGHVYAEIGPNKLPILVHEIGAKGGFQYQFNTGPEGAIWLISNKESRNEWNVRVRVSSLCLALNGVRKTQDIILKTLYNDLLAKGPDDNDHKPRERVSRFDYCLDFLFEEKPNFSQFNFVCAGRVKKLITRDIPVHEESTGQSVNYIRVGKLPNRQIVIYNKITEISASSKIYWWRIWKLNKADIKGEIWRIEIRAGKKELNKWNLRRFEDFEEMAGDVIKTTLEEYQYTIPNLEDKNRNRWPMSPIWENVIAAVKRDLFDYISDANRNAIIKELREAVIDRYQKLISGVFVGYTAATGKDISEIPGVLDLVSAQILDEVSNNPQKFRQKYKKKLDKFSFYEDKEIPEN